MVHIAFDRAQVAEFCRKWKVRELSLFGSVLRDDFGPESDVDVLVEFAPGGGITFDSRVAMLDELRAIFGREVDLVEKRTLRNPFRRHAILRSKETVHAS